MGAFDAELYALGYRFPRAEEPEVKRLELAGPVWEGKCVGHCSAEVCTPCPSNNRLSEVERIKTYSVHRKYSRGPDDSAKFIRLYPGYKAWLNRIEGEGE